MAIGIINYLDISALLEAQRDDRLAEELEAQRGNAGAYELNTESYCIALSEMKKRPKTGLSVDDVKRKEFLTNY